MKHASSREMYRYWTALRGRRAAPQREEIDPAALRRVLGDSFILSVEPCRGHAIRLAGTRVCALFCREIKAASFLNFWERESRPLVDSLVEIVSTELSVVVAGAYGQPNSEPAVPLELLLLPLAPSATRHARLIGVLAPLQPAYWIGSSPVETLTLGAFRYIEAHPDAVAVFPPRPPTPSYPGNPSRHSLARLHPPRFIVYEGGAAANHVDSSPSDQ